MRIHADAVLVIDLPFYILVDVRIRIDRFTRIRNVRFGPQDDFQRILERSERPIPDLDAQLQRIGGVDCLRIRELDHRGSFLEFPCL